MKKWNKKVVLTLVNYTKGSSSKTPLLIEGRVWDTSFEKWNKKVVLTLVNYTKGSSSKTPL